MWRKLEARASPGSWQGRWRKPPSRPSEVPETTSRSTPAPNSRVLGRHVAGSVASAASPAMTDPGSTTSAALSRTAVRPSLVASQASATRRIVLEEIAETAGLFRGLRQHRFAYRFELESHLDAPSTVELVDHLPVSQLDDIRVVIDPGRSRGWITDPQHGLSRRPTPLAPRGKATAELAFRIDVPRAYD